MNKKAQQRLSSEDQKAVALVIGAIGLIFFILVLIITLARIVFWTSVILFFVAIVYFIIAIFIDIERTKYENYFDGIPHILLALFLIVLFWGSAHVAFPIGYSPLSYKIIEMNDQYQEMMSLPSQITIQALNQTCNSVPTYEYCETILKPYELAEKVNDISDTAEVLTWVFRLRL